ncbi:MAG TPA: DUF1292 domain-containing protein [Desulfotomaculum sp.]|nr:DUF1292 domain-containing protein [Desulfotomaculum sp.]HCJ78479.1 DUF1292 domain-containing protein [Desulfotomaculum sp.]
MLEREDTITLIDEDGEEQDFFIVDELTVEGNKYAVLLSLEEEESVEDEEDEEDEGEAVILKYVFDEEGNEILEDIEDDEEWEKVANAWEEMLIQENS